MEKNETLMDTVKTVVYAVVIALVIRTFAFEPFHFFHRTPFPVLHGDDKGKGAPA